MKKLLMLSIFALLCADAQESVIRWNGEMRFRTEADGRDFSTRSPMNLYTLSRIRLGAEIRPAERLSLHVKIQDSRQFGEEVSTTSNQRNLDLFEGYVLIDSFFLPQLSMKLGRMSVGYGSERIIGSVGWSNVGRAFDGLIFRYASGSAALDLFAMNVSDFNTPPASVSAASVAFQRENGTLLLGGFYTNPFSRSLHFSAYGVNEMNKNRTVAGKDDLQRYTAGTQMKGSVDDLSYDGEVAYQFGTERGSDISGYMAAFALGYSMKQSPLRSVSAHLDLLSGTPPTSATVQTFVPPYATGHKFYGFMDYFVSMKTQTFNRGMVDAYLRAEVKPAGNLSATVTLHHFTAQQNFSTTDNARDFGQEIDIISKFMYTKDITFELGLSAFVPNTLMRRAFNADDVAGWTYLAAQIGF